MPNSFAKIYIFLWIFILYHFIINLKYWWILNYILDRVRRRPRPFFHKKMISCRNIYFKGKSFDQFSKKAIPFRSSIAMPYLSCAWMPSRNTPSDILTPAPPLDRVVHLSIYIIRISNVSVCKYGNKLCCSIYISTEYISRH